MKLSSWISDNENIEKHLKIAINKNKANGRIDQNQSVSMRDIWESTKITKNSDSKLNNSSSVSRFEHWIASKSKIMLSVVGFRSIRRKYFQSVSI